MDVHDSHEVVAVPEGVYCIHCAEWSRFLLAQPCRGEPHTGNLAGLEHVKEAIIRGA